MSRFVSNVIWFLVYLNLNRIQFGECLESGTPFASSAVCKKSNVCLSFVTQADCAADEYLDVIESEGCCPMCKKGIPAKCGECNDIDANAKCAPGLRCEKNVCELNKEKCSYTYHLPDLEHRPHCESDGTFAAKQCKGDMIYGRCFCYSETGKRIFGWDWRNNDADNNMTCECSRRRAAAEAEGRIDSTLHCLPNGNFEELQCDSGICWCADERTGRVMNGSRAVPEHLWTALPCYDFMKMGTNYLRQCESAAHAQSVIRKALKLRGTYDVSLNNIKCDYDGNYGTYFIENRIVACMWRDGSRITPFSANANEIQLDSMNCYCARDTKIFEQNDFSFPLTCNGYGNYDPIQNLNGRYFCVDSDGFAVTDYLDVNSAVGLNCNQYLYYAANSPTCSE